MAYMPGVDDSTHLGVSGRIRIIENTGTPIVCRVLVGATQRLACIEPVPGRVSDITQAVEYRHTSRRRSLRKLKAV